MTLVIVGVVLLIWQAGSTTSGRRLLDKWKLTVPVFGTLFMKVAVARFTRTLGTLIRSGVNILNALEIVAKTANNVVMVQLTEDVVRVIEGLPLTNVEWTSPGNMIFNFKIMTITVPQLRADQEGNSGIAHLAA